MNQRLTSISLEDVLGPGAPGFMLSVILNARIQQSST